jgi:quercetin dioxygenase-like cupin family protein
MKPFPLLSAVGLLAAAFIGLTAVPWAQADAPAQGWLKGLTRTDLARRDLTAPGYEVIQSRVDFEQGVDAPWHSHPGGEEVAFVIQGTVEYQLADGPPIRLQAGNSLVIPAGTPHVARNVGEGKASELATYIVKKGSQLVKPEQAPHQH